MKKRKQMKNGDICVSTINGFKVANIYNDSLMSFVGIGVISGSNFESPDVYGVSHFVEHMFFKGTSSRKSCKQISEEFGLMGAQQNAYTDNIEVFYHCDVPSENVKKSHKFNGRYVVQFVVFGRRN